MIKVSEKDDNDGEDENDSRRGKLFSSFFHKRLFGEMITTYQPKKLSLLGAAVNGDCLPVKMNATFGT